MKKMDSNKTMRDTITMTGNDFVEGVDPRLLGLNGFHHLLSLLGVVPEIGGFGLLFFFGDLRFKGVNIKIAMQGILAAYEVFDGFGGGHFKLKTKR